MVDEEATWPPAEYQWPIQEAQGDLRAAIVDATSHEVVFTDNGEPVGVLISPEAYASVLDRLEDAEDALTAIGLDPDHLWERVHLEAEDDEGT